jgi:hypothetical protein
MNHNLYANLQTELMAMTAVRSGAGAICVLPFEGDVKDLFYPNMCSETSHLDVP